MPQPNITVTTKGPLFNKRFSPMLRKVMSSTVQDLVEQGEVRLHKRLRTRPAGVFLSVAEARPRRASKGHYLSNVSGRASGLEGLITDGGVIYGPWLEGTSSRNQTTRFKGYGQFRQTGQWLQNKRVRPTLKKHLTAFIRRNN